MYGTHSLKVPEDRLKAGSVPRPDEWVFVESMSCFYCYDSELQSFAILCCYVLNYFFMLKDPRAFWSGATLINLNEDDNGE